MHTVHKFRLTPVKRETGAKPVRSRRCNRIQAPFTTATGQISGKAEPALRQSEDLLVQPLSVRADTATGIFSVRRIRGALLLGSALFILETEQSHRRRGNQKERNMSKSIQSILAGMLTLCVIGTMTACKDRTQPAESAAGSSVSVSETSAPAEQSSAAAPAKSSESADSGAHAAAFPFELVTDNDAVVTFTHVPERVLAANPNAGEQLMALGLGDKIIATSYNNAAVAEAFRAEYESKPSLTTSEQPTLEVVLALNPDFIYGRSSAFGKKGIADHDTLTEHGIMSLASIEGYKLGADVDDVYQDFYNLGRIFQVEDRAEAVVSEMKARIGAVEAVVKDAEPVKVFNFDMQQENGAYTPGNNFTSKLIRRAGGVNVFEHLEKTWNTVSWEAVLEANPDVIVINNYGSTPLEEKIEQLKTNPALSGLKAVQEENFIVVTLPEVFASSRIADTVEKFAKGFHPERFK